MKYKYKQKNQKIIVISFVALPSNSSIGSKLGIGGSLISAPKLKEKCTCKEIRSSFNASSGVLPSATNFNFSLPAIHAK